MALTVTWGTRVINVLRADMTLIQSTPTEIRELDLNQFRLDLKDLEDSVDGMMFPDTHSHNPPLDVGGVTLARSVEIINDYTVTFEDAQYAVNLSGANSNVGDRVNVNQVSVRSANSAGLVTSAAIEFGEYGGGVTIDVINGESGVIYPKGTARAPVDNLVDAMLIATSRGFNKLFIMESMTLGDSVDINAMTVIGNSHVNTVVTMADSAICDNVTIKNCRITGVLDGGTHLDGCVVDDITYVNGHIHNCGIVGTIVLGGNEDAVIFNCSTVDPNSLPIIDCGGSGQDMVMTDWSGKVTIKNITSSVTKIGIQIDGGQITLDPTITAGNFCISGVGTIIDNATSYTNFMCDGLMNTDTVATAVWDTPVLTHDTEGSMGEHQKGLAFGDHVHVSTSGESGTTFPLGTHKYPIDNIADAVTVAASIGLHKLRIDSNITVLATDDISGLLLYGGVAGSYQVTLASGSTTVKTEFSNLIITGNLAVQGVFRDSIITNLTGFQGIAHQCMLMGTITLGGTGSQYFLDCYADQTSGSPIYIDCNGTGVNPVFRGLSGGINITNKTGTDIVGVAMNTGKVTVESSVTNGSVIVKGVGNVVDNSTGATVVDISGLVNPSDILNTSVDGLGTGTAGQVLKELSFGNHVHISSTGSSGTDYPLGSHAYPVDNMADAITIMTANSLHQVWIDEDFTIPTTLSIDGYVVRGSHSLKSEVTIATGTSTDFCEFSAMTLTGMLDGWVTLRDMILEDIDGLECVAHQVMLSGTIGLNGTKTSHFLDCYSGGENQATVPELDFSGSGRTCVIKGFKGGIKLVNKTGSESVSIIMDGGVVIVDSTVTAGTITVGGSGAVLDNSTGTTVIDRTYLITPLKQGLKMDEFMSLK